MKFIFKAVFIATLILGGIANTVHAETRISGDINSDQVWTSSASPYLLTGDVKIREGATLKVEKGVTISAAPEAVAEFIEYNPAIYVYGGNLSLSGSTNSPVVIKDLSGIFVYKGFSNPGFVETDHVVKSGGTGFMIENSSGRIKNTTISDSYIGIDIREGSLEVSSSTLIKNEFGIYVESPQILSYSLTPVEASNSSINISNSIFADNTTMSIFNGANNSIEAPSNWWGSQDGPQLDGTNSIRGNITYDPWLKSPPVFGGDTPKLCCSSVLFIPGLEGTRLSIDQNQLWEPNRNADVQKLFLDEYGSSTNSGIKPGEIIGKAYGVKSVYGGFKDFMDNLVGDGYINSWKSYGYDWRGSVKDVATNQSLIDSVIATASSSKTGSVTIVAHSNGGLVAKYLMKTLEGIGKSNLIDKVISVAVPYLGTPEAILGLLHGDHTSILGGILASATNMRILGLNMPSAYGLLPSVSYFSSLMSPTIAFASTTIEGLNSGAYPKEIVKHEEQDAFLIDSLGQRKTSKTTDVSWPAKANKFLLDIADSMHSTIDSYIWPKNILTWSIFGWNNITTKAISYGLKDVCSTRRFVVICNSNLYHDIDTTLMGDGTVVASSTTWGSDHILGLDLREVSSSESNSIDHVNILESSTTQNLIKKLITDGDIKTDKQLPSGVSLGVKDPSQNNYFRFSTHSPVDLHIYDSQGRHTGFVQKDASQSANDFILGSYESKIPGSSYRIIQNTDGSYETYITVPKQDSEKFDIRINGNDFGFFTFEAQEYQGDVKMKTEVYETEPTTPFMEASVSVGNTYENMKVDIDGDGLVDMSSKVGGNGLPGNATNTESAQKIATSQTIQTINKILPKLTLSGELKKSLKNKLEKLERALNRGEVRRDENVRDTERKKIGHIRGANINKDKSTKMAEAIMEDLE